MYSVRLNWGHIPGSLDLDCAVQGFEVLADERSAVRAQAVPEVNKVVTVRINIKQVLNVLDSHPRIAFPDDGRTCPATVSPAQLRLPWRPSVAPSLDHPG
jgi:hypothetical protein